MQAEVTQRPTKIVVQREYSREIWASTLEDCKAGYTAGPFFTATEVWEFAGTDRWLPTERFAVLQKNKVRGCDNASSGGSGVNTATFMAEKLQVPTTDGDLAIISAIGRDIPLAAWVIGLSADTDHTGTSAICHRFDVGS